MEMEKRFILAMVLSMLFILLYRYLFIPPAPPPAPVDSPPAATSPPPVTQPEPLPAAQSAAQSAVPDQAAEPETRVPEQEIVISDPRYRIRISNQGGLITSWKYLERNGHEMELVELPPAADAFAPLALWNPDPELTRRINSAVFEIQVPGEEASAEPLALTTPAELTLVYRGAGLRVTKTLAFRASSFLVEVGAEVMRQGQALPVQLQVGPGLGASDQALGADTRALQKVVVRNAGSVERIDYGSVEAKQLLSGSIEWAGLESQYFAGLLLPPAGGAFASCQLRPFTWKENNEDVRIASLEAPIQPGEKLRVYFGPKEGQTLRAIQPSLVEVIDFGWFGVIVEPLLLALNWINSGVRNYGFSIIILTFLITLALFPLRYKQMVSMKKMQKLQPQVKAIQERYKKAKKSAQERQKMNMEMMNLYKQHGVNPLGGCLPLLLQMPILFAFYSMLNSTFELRGAPFIWWIQDLAAKDPYYVTPILMGLTMLISMKMTPTTTTDPMQSRMMTIMPIVMTFMFLSLSAGLNLYFLFSNLFSIAMQKASEQYLPSMKAV